MGNESLFLDCKNDGINNITGCNLETDCIQLLCFGETIPKNGDLRIENYRNTL